jgi:hypothetical protein
MVSAIVARRKARSLNTSERTEPKKEDGYKRWPLYARALAQPTIYPTGHHSVRIGDLFLT